MSRVESDDDIDEMLRDCGSIGYVPSAGLDDCSFGCIYEAPGVNPLDVRTVSPTALVATAQVGRLGITRGTQIEIDVGDVSDDPGPNLLEYSEDFMQWDLFGEGSVVPNLPDHDVTDSDVNVTTVVNQRMPYTEIGVQYCFSVHVRKFAAPADQTVAAELNFYRRCELQSDTGRIQVNPFDGTFAYKSAQPDAMGVIDADPYWRIYIARRTPDAACRELIAQFRPANSASADPNDGQDARALGTATFFGAQLEVGSYPTDYQLKHAWARPRTVHYIVRDLDPSEDTDETELQLERAP